MRFRGWVGVLCGVLIGVSPGMGWAGGLERLHEFLTQTQRGQADFEQQTLKGEALSGPVSRGRFQFSRPGKFRWEYHTPYAQTLVADGKFLWIWDPDLQQVTRKSQDQGLGSTPAALLAGNNALEKDFTLEEGGEQDGLTWVNATPKSEASGFSMVKLGFDARHLARMELRDNFGHHLVIRFTGFEQNPQFAGDPFHFVPPAGADVIQ